jgi:hypothetical protein
MEADEEKCSGPFVVSEHGGQFAIHTQRAIKDVVKLGAMKRAA